MAIVKKKAKTEELTGLTGYSVKLKRKVVIQDPAIDITNGRYIAKGTDDEGNKVVAIMSKDNAEGFIASGEAKPGLGWPKKKAAK